jgi:hypothetical protein
LKALEVAIPAATEEAATFQTRLDTENRKAEAARALAS